MADEGLRLIEVERQLRDLTEETIRTGERAIAVATVVAADRAENQRHRTDTRDALTVCTTKLTTLLSEVQELRAQQARLVASHEAGKSETLLSRMERISGSITWPGVVLILGPVSILIIIFDNQIKTFIISIAQVVYGH